jgi:K+ transporter
MSPDSEKDVSQLDDVADREELRNRYDLLLQEVRIALPGVQILLAFLLTAPFAQGFDDLDSWGRRAYGVALTGSMLSVVSLLTPAVLHRLGQRRARRTRLLWSIRFQVLGLLFLAIALIAALWGVARFVYGNGLAWAITLPTAAFLLLCWVALPLILRRGVRLP